MLAKYSIKGGNFVFSIFPSQTGIGYTSFIALFTPPVYIVRSPCEAIDKSAVMYYILYYGVFMGSQITTARLPLETRNKLLTLSRVKGKTKSDIIKESVELYYEQEEKEIDSFTLGEQYFGKYGSDEGDLSTTYKERIREKLRAKHNSC